jgi:D-alanyl-D-alanine dipeptidase
MRKIWLLLVAGVIAGCVPNRPSPQPSPAANTPELAIVPDPVADSLLVDISTVSPTIRVEMRYATANNFTGAKLPGYEANRAFLRREAAGALAAVQNSLATRGLGLKIFDAYRPVRATEAMVAWTERVHRPELITDGYIASRSRHNLGVAVDLTLVDLASGKELDMGTPFDTFSSAAHTANATGVAAANRALLKSAMSAAGFSPYSEEWWHFSFTVDHPVRFDRVIR